MTIAVISDLHDNLANWELILKILNKEKVTTLLNCGDTCAPATLEEMSKTFPGTIHTVFGNVADQELEMKLVKSFKNVQHHGEVGDVTIANRRIGFVHQPKDIKPLLSSSEFNLICHGHTHLKRWEPFGQLRTSQTFVLNPGTAGGVFQYPSFAMIELSSMRCQFHDIAI